MDLLGSRLEWCQERLDVICTEERGNEWEGRCGDCRGCPDHDGGQPCDGGQRRAENVGHGSEQPCEGENSTSGLILKLSLIGVQRGVMPSWLDS